MCRGKSLASIVFANGTTTAKTNSSVCPWSFLCHSGHNDTADTLFQGQIDLKTPQIYSFNTWFLGLLHTLDRLWRRWSFPTLMTYR